MAPIDSRWFAEDRKLPKSEQRKAIEDSKEAIKSSTLITRRLKSILQDEVEKTYTREEDYEGEGWERKVLAQVARRKTLKEIIALLP